MELRSHSKEGEARVIVAASSTEASSMMIDTRTKRSQCRKPTIRLLASVEPPSFVAKTTIIQLLIVMNLLFASWHETGFRLIKTTVAVSVQKLSVPDLVVIDQLNQQQHSRSSIDQHQQLHRTQNVNLSTNSQPEAASLINSHQDLNSTNEQQQITFECLISFDKRKDKNLVVKWHHDDRIEPIYQWIPELHKRFIAPQYRAYIAPIVSTAQQPQQAAATAVVVGADSPQGSNATTTTLGAQNGSQSSIQLLEAGFRLVRPSKELGGKYTCSAISSQNDDSKWKKMIVYTPPRSFRFNASRTDIGALLASQRERLIHPSMIGMPASGLASSPFGSSPQSQLPLAYRMRGFDGNQQPAPFGSQTTISPQMYSTIDYVNVNQQRARQSSPTVNLAPSSAPSSPWLVGQPTNLPQAAFVAQLGQTNKLLATGGGQHQPQHQGKQNGVKLVCDIDQVFPVPEVSIYRLANLDGSHPDKLAKLDTRIERNPITGLYHVQVLSILEDDELQMKYGLNEPVYFECLMALTNLELGKYSDNKRSITYRPGHLTNSPLGAQTSSSSEDINSEQAGNSASPTIRLHLGVIWTSLVLMSSCLLVV